MTNTTLGRALNARNQTLSSSCPDSDTDLLCGASCSHACPIACTGRSPDHPVGICYGAQYVCSMDSSGYTRECPFGALPPYYCGVYHVAAADAPVAMQYGQCLGVESCLWLATHLPGGFDCYDETASLVQPP